MSFNEMDLMLEAGLREEKISAPAQKLAGRHKRISRRNLRVFSSGLVRLLQGGVPILRALELVGKEYPRGTMKQVVEEAGEEIRQGRSLSEALRKMNLSAPHYFIPMIQAGEMSGNLDKVLETIASYLEKEEEQNRKIREAVTYPAFVFILGFVTILFLLKFVLPRMTAVYSNFGKDLPVTTQVLMVLGDWLFPITVMAVAGSIACFAIFRKYAGVIFSGMVEQALKLPVFGSLAGKMLLARFSSLLAMELGSGIPVLSALHSIRGTFSLKFYDDDLVQAAEKLSHGKSLSGSLEGIQWVSEGARALILSGEETGRLPEVLTQIEKDSSRDIDEKTHFILKLLEPALILVVGVVTGFIVVSTILPIFEINELVQ